MKIILYQTKSKNRKQKFSWRIIAANRRQTIEPGEGFSTKQAARKSLQWLISRLDKDLELEIDNFGEQILGSSVGVSLS